MFVCVLCFDLTIGSTCRMPKTKGAMDNRLKTLEKNMESLRKAMEEREASANKSMKFMWKRMEDWEERMNQ